MGRMAGPDSPPVPLARIGPAVLDVDGHGGEGVDHAQGVGPGLDGGAGRGGDVRDVGRELDDQDVLACTTLRTAAVILADLHRVDAELDAAVLDVGAGDVQLHAADDRRPPPAPRRPRRNPRSSSPATLTKTGRPSFSSSGHLLAEERLQPDVGQADGVEHARAGLDDALVLVARRAARAVMLLGDERAELPQVHEVGVLVGVAARAAGGHQRVGQLHAGEVTLRSTSIICSSVELLHQVVNRFFDDL